MARHASKRTHLIRSSRFSAEAGSACFKELVGASRDAPTTMNARRPLSPRRVAEKLAGRRDIFFQCSPGLGTHQNPAARCTRPQAGSILDSKALITFKLRELPIIAPSWRSLTRPRQRLWMWTGKP